MNPLPHPAAPAAGPVKTIAVVVDGIPVKVPALTPHPITGQLIPTTMIQACERVGVRVPHFCYHPKLPVAGNCRMCLVEYGTPALGPDRKPLVNRDGTLQIRRATRPAIACATPVSPGLEIYTQTPAVRDLRRSVLEFLLINHPLDCPICDQAGECTLQEYAVEYGQPASRFAEDKVRKPKQVDLGPRIVLDDERCVLCGRCIRFARDWTGDDALGFLHRGSETTLAGDPARPFDNPYSLNTVDLCPVGALTSKDFRFQMRVWFLKNSPGLCAACGNGCNLRIDSRENRIYRFVPRSNPDVNADWLCDAGRLSYAWIGRPDRLSQVVLRKEPGRPEPGRWPEVLAEIARRLRQAASGTLAILASGRLTNEELYLVRQLALHLNALTDIVPHRGDGDDFLIYPDKNPNTAGAVLLGVAPATPGAQLANMRDGFCRDDLRSLVVIGEDAAAALGEHFLDKLELLVVSDVLPTPTTAAAHFLLPGCAPAEKAGSFINAYGRVQRFEPAVAPPGDARPEWQFLRELVIAVTGQTPPDSVGGLFDALALQTRALEGITWASLGPGGRQISAEFFPELSEVEPSPPTK